MNKCTFCYKKDVPAGHRTCGDAKCLHDHLELCKFRKALSDKYGDTWDTTELQKVYSVEGFGGGLCVVTRKSDGKRGSLDFTHSPRFYHSFQEG